ncbi:uncharacterized protein LOC129600356 [Paramacrobiotus metropolitanus]|uniref:uncharacterized protein LOC129600356 n=1 Tax=Paramacrobiotus metropolitanus TaxID=2943436 RepID=UPI002445C3E9|nr:uncharacterized protein LOC129600356 [Paramacrobiotus metropolitanus]
MYVYFILLTISCAGGALSQQLGGSIAQSLQNNGVLRQSPNYNPCASVNCGPNRYCQVVNLGSSSIRSYQCRTNPAPISQTALPVCYDRVEIRVPAGTSNSGSGSAVPVIRTACRTQCTSNRNCGFNQICCTRGCDRICYSPRTTVVDYTG